MDSESVTRNDKRTVLEMFGLELQVSNPRLAELLTMDAKEALTTDVHELGSAERVAEAGAEAAQAAPDVVLAPQLPRDAEDARRLHAFRHEVQAIGSQLGFSAGGDGTWRSPQGVTIVTRSIDRALSFAAASHYVCELATRSRTIGGEDATALLIVDSQPSAEVFKVAVRQQRLHDVMRTISIDNLREVRRLVSAGRLGHRQAVVLLVPVADIDVGEVLSILDSRAAEPHEPAA